MSTIPRGLFLNTWKAQCSIYESGKMSYNSLLYSDKYKLDYKEINDKNRVIPANYDFYIFNYHPVTMGWLDLANVKNLSGFKATIVLEVLPNDPFIMCPADVFDAYLVLDPTIDLINSKVHAFPRPLEIYNKKLPEYKNSGIPKIGSFGFATKGKGFESVINAVNNEFDEAIININIPKSDYVSEDLYNQLIVSLKSIKVKPSIQVILTDKFYSKDELIEWCALNTLNLFLYSRPFPGLAATTDQAIVSGRPLAVSTNPTFRHIHRYIDPYPVVNLKESIEKSEEKVRSIKHDWHPVNFAKKFEKVLIQNEINSNKSGKKELTLPNLNSKHVNRKVTLKDFVPPIMGKIVRKIKNSLNSKKNISSPPSINHLRPFIHYALNSYSQHNEDLLIDLILNKETGFYVDVGANDPIFNSNTKRFYSRGWTGINIEPNHTMYQKLKIFRPRDINLNLAIGDEKGNSVIYNLSDDSSLTTLDYEGAQKMSKLLNLNVDSDTVEIIPLKEVLSVHLGDNAIDFMSVDAEGFDLKVLRSNDWILFRPTIVMVESNNEFNDIVDFMLRNNYIHIFNNYFNAIFIDMLTKNELIKNRFNWKYNC